MLALKAVCPSLAFGVDVCAVCLFPSVVLLPFTVGVSYQSHVDQLAPSVQDLAKMEKHAQTMFLKMHSGQWLVR